MQSSEIWAENRKNFNKIGDVTQTISSEKAEFANIVEFVNIVRIFDTFTVSCNYKMHAVFADRQLADLGDKKNKNYRICMHFWGENFG